MRKILLSAFSVVVLAAAVTVALTSCGPEPKAPLLTKAPANFNDLVAAAKKEGQLTVIALPHDWVNYGEAISHVREEVRHQDQRAEPRRRLGRRDRGHQGQQGQQGPAGPGRDRRRPLLRSRRQGGRPALPVQGADLGHDPRHVKDADGYWYGDYYGALAFEVNLDVVKNAAPGLGRPPEPGFKGKVALAGDPRTANQAIMTIGAAALANGGSFDNVKPGLDFFDKLNKAGNFVPLIAVPGTVDSGETPITVRWDYNALSNRDKSDGNPDHRRHHPRHRRRGRRLRPGHQRLRARIPTPPGSGWSSSTPTKARSSG